MDKSVEYYNKGLAFYTGNMGCVQDYKKAFEYFVESSKLGNTSATNYLGVMYLNGLGVKQNVNLAIKYFESICIGVENPNWYAAYNLAIIFYEGKGVEKDLNKAYKLFESVALSHLGKKSENNSIYSNSAFFAGNIIMNSNPKYAFSLFVEAGKSGKAEAYHNIGYMFENHLLYMVGNSEVKDKNSLTLQDKIIMKQANDQKITAIGFYKKAANLGYIGSMLRLGYLYTLYGKNQESMMWLKNAADLGSVEAKKALKKMNFLSYFG